MTMGKSCAASRAINQGADGGFCVVEDDKEKDIFSHGICHWYSLRSGMLRFSANFYHQSLTVNDSG